MAAASRGAGSSGVGNVPSEMRSVLWPVIVVPFRRERRGTPVRCSGGPARAEYRADRVFDQALREVLANRRRAVALTRLRDAATEGAFDLAVLQDKQRYRR
jgi:hypothetical protein